MHHNNGHLALEVILLGDTCISHRSHAFPLFCCIDDTLVQCKHAELFR